MKRFIVGSLCLILLMLGSFSNTTAQDGGVNDDSEIPYIYYFSADLNAMVVERADGTDTRILGNALLETEGNYEQYHIYRVEEAEWSPSGEWLAWKVMYLERHLSGIYKKRLFVMSADGQRVLPIIYNYREIDFSWSPTEDILAFYGTVGQVDGLSVNPEAVVITMYDFARNEIIFSQQVAGGGIRIDIVGYGRYPILAHWMPDGQHVIFEIQNIYADTMHYWVINQDGSFHSIHQFVNAIPVEVDSYNPSSFANGWVVYIQPSSIPHALIGCTLRFDNIVTGEQHIVELLEKDCPFMEQIVWDAEQEQAIFLGEGVWLWTTSSWVTFSEIPPYRRPPNSYRISLLASNWSPSGKYVLLDGENGIFQIDTYTQEMTMLISFEEDDVPYYEFWVWLNENEVLVSGFHDDDVSIDYHFDFSSGVAEAHYHPIQASYVRYSPFILTNDGVEIYIADGAVII